jgi:type VI protein secretion system component VasF
MPDPIPLHRQAGTRPEPGYPRLVDNRPDLYAQLRDRREPLHHRLADWLGRTFGESPRGFAFFAATLFPICAAAFAVGYFGLRELLAGVGL